MLDKYCSVRREITVNYVYVLFTDFVIVIISSRAGG